MMVCPRTKLETVGARLCELGSGPTLVVCAVRRMYNRIAGEDYHAALTRIQEDYAILKSRVEGKYFDEIRRADGKYLPYKSSIFSADQGPDRDYRIAVRRADEDYEIARLNYKYAIARAEEEYRAACIAGAGQ